MALKLEFCNVIVPVKKIREKLGDEAFERQFSTTTDTTWHDGHLFRDGCMNQYDPEKNLVWLKGHEPGVAVGPVGRKVAGDE
jgi:hypothetical protein